MDFSSAQLLAPNNAYRLENANHMEVCKPASVDDSSYMLLLRFIITCLMVSFNNPV